ncbi:ankyrin repeat-containing protein [Saccharothrix sp. NRRL B-16314]|uniref:ankyrin repeat-containing protein n=1 Tax=Saccharothrix sp. NRRL B-16314 TaxID=1463825 RepID=UPI000525EAFB|nr:ankyrin repeat-containing protein [Saccharothrix sp. NRRL B-16314]
MAQLRALLDAGADVEDDKGDGCTLLQHAVDVEYDGHLQSGEPLQVAVTAFLLERGADPLCRYNGVAVVDEAAGRGHWSAVELMRAPIDQDGR